jgi:hypothetical protein
MVVTAKVSVIVNVAENEKNCPIPQKSLVKFNKYDDRYCTHFGTKAGYWRRSASRSAREAGWAQAWMLILCRWAGCRGGNTRESHQTLGTARGKVGARNREDSGDDGRSRIRYKDQFRCRIVLQKICAAIRRKVESWKRLSMVRKNTGWKPMLHYAVAPSLRVHGESSRDDSERSLDNPQNNVA